MFGRGVLIRADMGSLEKMNLHRKQSFELERNCTGQCVVVCVWHVSLLMCSVRVTPRGRHYRALSGFDSLSKPGGPTNTPSDSLYIAAAF